MESGVTRSVALDLGQHGHGNYEPFRISGEIFIQIMRYLDPFDILSMRKTCRFISDITKSKVVWLDALEEVINRQSNFKLHLPVDRMSVLELQHAATAPRRFLSLIKGLDLDEVPLPYSHRQLFFRRPPPLTGTYNVDGIFLIPGGRFMISMSGETLNLWDIGYNMNVAPSAYPLATADNCGKLYALCRTSNGKGVVLATKKTFPGNQATFLHIYQVKLEGNLDNSVFKIALKAQLDLGSPNDPGFTVRLSPSMALIHLRSHIAIWNWAEGMGCKWPSSSLDNPNGPVFHAFDRTVLTCNTDGAIFCWDIPKLDSLSSSNFDSITTVENEPKSSIVHARSPTTLLHFRASGSRHIGPLSSQPFLVTYQDPIHNTTFLSLYSVLDSGHRGHPLIPEDLVVPSGTSPHVYGDHPDKFRGPLSAVLHCEGSLVFCSPSDARALVVTSVPTPTKAHVGTINPVSRYLTAKDTLPGGSMHLAFCPLSGRVVYSGSDGAVQLRDFLLAPK